MKAPILRWMILSAGPILLCAASAKAGGPYAIDCYTIDGGGID